MQNIYLLIPSRSIESHKWTNQVRKIFDASSHSPGNPSLKDALEVGPNLVPAMLATLVRILFSQIAILHLILSDKDREVTQFLLYKTTNDPEGILCTEEEIVTYRFAPLPFGLAWSASASFRELVTMYKERYPTATINIENNTYIDDFVIGTATDTEDITLYQEM